MLYGSLSHEASGAVFPRRALIPGLAGDSAPGPAATAPPQPTASGPTPVPTVPSGPTSIAIRIKMVANELSYTGSGDPVVPVDVTALITGPVPAGTTVSYLSGAIIDPHPHDTCQWTPVVPTTALDAKASLQTTLIPPKQEVTLEFPLGPEWHFDVACPGKQIRVPTGAEESLPKFLTRILSPGNPGPIKVELSTYHGPSNCVWQRGVVQGNNESGSVTIVVDIVTEPCYPPVP
jgi:hypothetical protein